MPAEMKDIEFILDDATVPDASTVNHPSSGKGSNGSVHE
jgi:hypothetical protein